MQVEGIRVYRIRAYKDPVPSIHGIWADVLLEDMLHTLGCRSRNRELVQGSCAFLQVLAWMIELR